MPGAECQAAALDATASTRWAISHLACDGIVFNGLLFKLNTAPMTPRPVRARVARGALVLVLSADVLCT
jgi:hypothetical protein